MKDFSMVGKGHHTEEQVAGFHSAELDQAASLICPCIAGQSE